MRVSVEAMGGMSLHEKLVPDDTNRLVYSPIRPYRADLVHGAWCAGVRVLQRKPEKKRPGRPGM